MHIIELSLTPHTHMQDEVKHPYGSSILIEWNNKYFSLFFIQSSLNEMKNHIIIQLPLEGRSSKNSFTFVRPSIRPVTRLPPTRHSYHVLMSSIPPRIVEMIALYVFGGVVVVVVVHSCSNRKCVLVANESSCTI